MGCSLAAALGVLVHVEVTRQTVATAHEKALGTLHDVSRASEAGEALPRDAGLDPVGLPRTLRALVVSGQRGTYRRDAVGVGWVSG
ncbi:hypothetical protein [Streptomyces sp. NRRL F-2580]|uniref:hypothetical protein n=1 Tax=Streptomyces sp. NRRL F-2580 TaxID=1463841 RepID=UPI0018FEE0EB